MIYQIFAITWKELKVLSRDRAAFAVLFILPIAFILTMTFALQGLFSSGTDNNPLTLLVVNDDRGDLAAKVIADLGGVSGLDLVDRQNGDPLTRLGAEDLITQGQYSIALIFPADFSERIHTATGDSASGQALVSFITDPTVSNQMLSPARGMVQGYIEREASIAQAGEQTKDGFERMAASVPASQAALIREMGTRFAADQNQGHENLGVRYEVVSPAKYQAQRTPTSAEQNVPGYTIYGVFFIMQTIATSLFREKNEGTFRRIQATPISRAALLTGKLLPYYLINLVQIALMFGVGVLVFKMNLGSDPIALILLSLATAAVATGLGLFVTTLGKTLEQVSSLSTLLSVILAVLGGMMVPTSIMPDFMQRVASFVPHSWALTGFQDVIVRGLGVSAVLPVIAVLMAYALIFWALALWRFRFE